MTCDCGICDYPELRDAMVTPTVTNGTLAHDPHVVQIPISEPSHDLPILFSPLSLILQYYRMKRRSQQYVNIIYEKIKITTRADVSGKFESLIHSLTFTVYLKKMLFVIFFF